MRLAVWSAVAATSTLVCLVLPGHEQLRGHLIHGLDMLNTTAGGAGSYLRYPERPPIAVRGRVLVRVPRRLPWRRRYELPSQSNSLSRE